jgi:hypothetical protein
MGSSGIIASTRPETSRIIERDSINWARKEFVGFIREI